MLKVVYMQHNLTAALRIKAHAQKSFQFHKNVPKLVELSEWECFSIFLFLSSGS